MSAGLHLLGLGAGSYLADLGAPSRNLAGHASRAVDVLWFELDFEPLAPSLSHLRFSLKIVRLSCSKRVAFAAVQSAVCD